MKINIFPSFEGEKSQTNNLLFIVMIFGFPFYCHLEFHAMNTQGHEMGKTLLLSAAAKQKKVFIRNL